MIQAYSVTITLDEELEDEELEEMVEKSLKRIKETTRDWPPEVLEAANATYVLPPPPLAQVMPVTPRKPRSRKKKIGRTKSKFPPVPADTLPTAGPSTSAGPWLSLLNIVSLESERIKGEKGSSVGVQRDPNVSPAVARELMVIDCSPPAVAGLPLKYIPYLIEGALPPASSSTHVTPGTAPSARIRDMLGITKLDVESKDVLHRGLATALTLVQPTQHEAPEFEVYNYGPWTQPEKEKLRSYILKNGAVGQSRQSKAMKRLRQEFPHRRVEDLLQILEQLESLWGISAIIPMLDIQRVLYLISLLSSRWETYKIPLYFKELSEVEANFFVNLAPDLSFPATDACWLELEERTGWTATKLYNYLPYKLPYTLAYTDLALHRLPRPPWTKNETALLMESVNELMLPAFPPHQNIQDSSWKEISKNLQGGTLWHRSGKECEEQYGSQLEVERQSNMKARTTEVPPFIAHPKTTIANRYIQGAPNCSVPQASSIHPEAPYIAPLVDTPYYVSNSITFSDWHTVRPINHPRPINRPRRDLPSFPLVWDLPLPEQHSSPQILNPTGIPEYHSQLRYG
ncbi:hypothetical protein P7C70_g3704, partial [Phenoliferia sp. Uapishka_3]